ncbi:hypothetical protein [Falsirhodobacter sp. alg1]|uniref:hypothetical protein n=1 Tax=Falsirhodobacter sp. alg1 TaxID=1472418 RepID=UPI000787F0F0|nr:hypothetical protein [Falsirhodobacter sp. alg1]
MQDPICRLTPRDHIRRDPMPMDRIFCEHGRIAPWVVRRRVALLARAVAEMEFRVRARHVAELPDLLRAFGRQAGRLGLLSLSFVAREAAACLATDDSVAFSALWARLEREAEAGLRPLRALIRAAL